ncbi:MAG: phosphatidylserine/phosphatidylglycerophosphate/cardiolipin synthase family protein [Elusimicrobia bacterium]|nr:phosphatidylserine/phosphatidylglycerophosphate/cardiolipin synthase family protein [Elusimicrobiota bacterium]
MKRLIIGFFVFFFVFQNVHAGSGALEALRESSLTGLNLPFSGESQPYFLEPPSYGTAALRPQVPETVTTATNLPQFGVYDYTSIPHYVFTDYTRISPVLVSAIDKTHHTLDVALYNLQLADVAQALIRAHSRGVKTRVVFDYGHVYPKTGREIQEVIDSGMEVKVMKGRGKLGSMHNKYAVFDGTVLETGSNNWSLSAENASFENMMFVFEPDIISGYQENFEWLWRQGKPAGDPSAYIPAAGQIPYDTTPSVHFNGATLPDYVFSPRGGTESAIIKAIDAAASEVDIAMFTFTSRPIMNALKRARTRGVRVKMVVYVKSEFPFKKEAAAAGMEVRYKAGRNANGLMHNKFAVIDGRLLINGSFNWSATAENGNAENTIFTLKPEYTAPYKAQFDQLYSRSFVMQ